MFSQKFKVEARSLLNFRFIHRASELSGELLRWKKSSGVWSSEDDFKETEEFLKQGGKDGGE